MDITLRIRASMSRTLYAARSTAAQSEEDISCLRRLDAPTRLVDSECGCAALQLEAAISQSNYGMPIAALYSHFTGDFTPAQWGHYAAAQALGLCIRMPRHIQIPRIN